MNPRFREHFIEDIALSSNEETAHPIYASFQASEDPRLHMIRVTYKTAMVLSMLEYMLGKQGFQKGFQSFTENHFHKIGSLRNFQYEFEEVFKENNGCISNTSISEKRFEPIQNPSKSKVCFTPPDLDWFFDQWFLQDMELDYALGNLKTQKKEGGDYLTEVEVKKTDQARMPLEVMLTTEDGKKVHQLILGDQKSKTLFFRTKSPAKKVSLDPDEQLLELKEKEILVTGGCGFIGSEITKQLSSIGANVTIIDNLSSGKEEYIKNFSNVKLIKTDLMNSESIPELVKTFGWTIPHPKISNHSSFSHRISTSADGSVKGKYDGRNLSFISLSKKLSTNSWSTAFKFAKLIFSSITRPST